MTDLTPEQKSELRAECEANYVSAVHMMQVLALLDECVRLERDLREEHIQHDACDSEHDETFHERVELEREIKQLREQLAAKDAAYREVMYINSKNVDYSVKQFDEIQALKVQLAAAERVGYERLAKAAISEGNYRMATEKLEAAKRDKAALETALCAIENGWHDGAGYIAREALRQIKGNNNE